MRRFRANLVLSLGLITATAVAAEVNLAETRSIMEKWVETRQMIGRVQADWQVEKETISQVIALYEKELENLQKQFHSTGTNTTQLDKELEKIKQENETLKVAAEEIKTTVGGLEREVLRLAKSWPAPLVERINALLRRIPEDPTNTKAALSERMQNVVGILSEADKFNGSVSVVSELRKNPAGAEVQVKTLYVGLGAAYFTDKAGEFAGTGTPSAEGWAWSTDAELASKIGRAIAIYENLQPAAFVALPVQIK